MASIAFKTVIFKLPFLKHIQHRHMVYNIRQLDAIVLNTIKLHVLYYYRFKHRKYHIVDNNFKLNLFYIIIKQYILLKIIPSSFLS